jgi:hypothetical protein
LVDLTQINNLYNGTNIFNVSSNNTRDFIDNYNILRFMVVFVSDNSFSFIFNNLTLNLTYIDTTYNAYDVTINSNLEGNVTLTEQTINYFNDTDFCY